MGIIIIFVGLSIITGLSLVGPYKAIKEDKIKKHYEQLMQQEQLDRIESMVTALETEWCTDEWHRSKGHKAILLEDNKLRTNPFNNQFIMQYINDEERMQCVTCGSLKVRGEFSYSDKSWATERIYTCNKCGNKYTAREGGQ